MSDLVPLEPSEAQLTELLSAILAADGSVRVAAQRLRETGLQITWPQLERLREDHAGMYQALAAERARVQEETIAQAFREQVRLSQRATTTFLTQLNEQLDDGTLSSDIKRQLPQVIQALAKVQQVGTDKLLTITGRPQDGGNGDPLEAAKELIRMGVLVPRERPKVDAETTAEEAP